MLILEWVVIDSHLGNGDGHSDGHISRRNCYGVAKKFHAIPFFSDIMINENVTRNCSDAEYFTRFQKPMTTCILNGAVSKITEICRSENSIQCTTSYEKRFSSAGDNDGLKSCVRRITDW